MGTNSCVPFRGRGPRSGEGVLEGKNRKETQSRAGRLSAVRITAECHIGAWPRTPYGPSRGSEGGRREIFESYSSCTLPAGPLWWRWVFESICVFGDNGGKPYNRASPVEMYPYSRYAGLPPEGEVCSPLNFRPHKYIKA